MAVDLYFKDDLQRILASKWQAAVRDKQGDELVGYVQALHDLAVEFGIPDPRVRQSWPELEPERERVWHVVEADGDNG